MVRGSRVVGSKTSSVNSRTSSEISSEAGVVVADNAAELTYDMTLS